MGDRVMAMGMTTTRTHGAQPETAITLKNQNGFAGPFAMGL